MSDYQDFCESYGGSANDPDFFDRWLNEYVTNTNQASTITKDILPKGKLIHIVKLIATMPAAPVGVIWNKALAKPLECYSSNHLISSDYDDPASWFVRNGFTVRSSEFNGYWYQVIYKHDHASTYLTVPKTKEYEKICDNLNKNWVENVRD